LDDDDDIFSFLEDEGMSWSEFNAAKDELIAAGLAHERDGALFNKE
jgi:hypothetical protein